MTLEEMLAKQASEKAEGNEDTPESDTPAEDTEWMKCYGRRVAKDNREVFGGGGEVMFQDNDGTPVKMVPGQVRKVPSGVVEFFNNRGPRATPVFVEPGSQKPGDSYVGPPVIH